MFKDTPTHLILRGDHSKVCHALTLGQIPPVFELCVRGNAAKECVCVS